MSSENLLIAGSIRFALSIVVVVALLFGSAGSFQYWNAWLFLAALFAPMSYTFVHLYRTNRSLLEKRLNMQEREKEQKTYVKLSLLWFVITFALPGLDFRFGWSDVPVWLVVVSVIVMVVAYILVVVAMLQNAFASRVIEIQEGQRLIDRGLYSIVRHPLYAAAALMYVSCPLVLGSYYALVPTLLLFPLLAYRIRNEEKVLLAGLPGYPGYTERVKWRLVPFVW